MLLERNVDLAEPTVGVARATHAVLGVAACYAAVLAIFWPTTWSMVAIWQTTTFEHCFLVIPISLWLVWRERSLLAVMAPRPFWPGLLAVAALGMIWLAAELGGVAALAHLSVIALIPAAVLVVFGTAWTRILWFPLAFLFFAAPLGDSLIPWLVDRTADFTVTALRLTGIPVYRESTHFVIPSGRWSVIETCSGVRFLIASVMAGSLYAWLMYRSTLKRALFMVAAVVAPIFANWIRAYVTVLVAHLTNNQWMAGDEHVTFGRILFGAVLLLMFWVGARWREDHLPDPAFEGWRKAAASAARAPVGARLPVAFFALLAALAAWPLAAHVLLKGGDARPVNIAPMTPGGGWKEGAAFATNWSPELEFPAATRLQYFERDGRRVGVFIGLYRNQDDRSKLANSYNRLVHSENRPWRLVGSSTVNTNAPLLGGQVRAGVLQGSTSRLLAWHWYWLGDFSTISATRAKLELAIARLQRRTDTSAWVAVFTPVDTTQAEAEATLAAFLQSNSANLDAALKATAAR